MHRPGVPVMRPITSAANAAEPSWAVRTYGSPPVRMASSSGSTLPLGTPNPWLTPAARRVATISSALFIARFILRRGVGASGRAEVGRDGQLDLVHDREKLIGRRQTPHTLLLHAGHDQRV